VTCLRERLLLLFFFSFSAGCSSEASKVYAPDRPFGIEVIKRIRVLDVVKINKNIPEKAHEPDVTCNRSRGFRPRLGRAHSRVTGFIFLHKDKGCIRPNAGTVLYCLKRVIKLTITEQKSAVKDISKLSRLSRESERIICREKRYHRNLARSSVRVGLEVGRSFVVCLYSSFVRQWILVL